MRRARARRSASTSIPTSPPPPCSTRAASRSPADHRHLVEDAAGVRRPDARRHRGQAQMQRGGRREAAPAGRRDLFHDERGRRAARAVLSAHHDRLRWPAARPTSASAAVGHLPARARPLRARRQAVCARGGGAPHDRATGGAIRVEGSRRVAPGAYADLVLFAPDTIADTATFERPTTPAAGIAGVWVNGRAVWRDGAATGERPGRALRRGELGPMGGTTAPH